MVPVRDATRTLPEISHRDLDTSFNPVDIDYRHRTGTRRIDDTLTEEDWNYEEMSDALGGFGGWRRKRLKNYKYIDNLTTTESLPLLACKSVISAARRREKFKPRD